MMILNVLLIAFYGLCAAGAYRAYRQDSQGVVFSAVAGAVWPIPVVVIYLLMGLGSDKVLDKVNKATKGARK